MWSPNRRVWNPKIKNVESKILHLICSLTTISGEVRIVKVTARTFYAAMTNTTTREFSTPSPGKLIPTTFVQQSLASSSSPDNPTNSSQGCVECCFYSAFMKYDTRGLPRPNPRLELDTPHGPIPAIKC